MSKKLEFKPKPGCKCTRPKPPRPKPRRARSQGRPRISRGWVTLEAYEKNPAMRRAPVQASQCGVSGEVFVKAIVGRYQSRDEEDLSQRLVRLRLMLLELGGEVPPMPATMPLWYQAEFLENLIDFDLDPPCGCAPATQAARS